jgi:hypothetical protein
MIIARFTRQLREEQCGKGLPLSAAREFRECGRAPQ